MLKVAIPNKGALADEAMVLVKEAGYRCRRYGPELAVYDAGNDVEFIFLRPRDIAIYVSNRTIDLGLTGRDLALDSTAEFEELLPLQFGKSTFRYAVPAKSALQPEQFGGLRIATSYEHLLRADLHRRGLEASIVKLDGAVEISIQLGVADAIADVVESGRTLQEAGLKVVGEPLLKSEAILISRDRQVLDRVEARSFVERLRGIIVAREYAMVEYDCPQAILEAACTVTPGIEAPTISPLREADWFAVKAMAKRSEINQIMDRLVALGAKGIIVTQIQTCRI